MIDFQINQDSIEVFGTGSTLAKEKPVFVFDLDGTLALIEHRRHLVEGKTKNWNEFFKKCVDDLPNIPVIKTLQMLMAVGADIIIMSGRSDAVKEETVAWLKKHVLNLENIHSKALLIMRQDGDFTPDDELKLNIYRKLPLDLRSRIVAIYDDRQKVVDAWRKEGIACFQVAPGDF